MVVRPKEEIGIGKLALSPCFDPNLGGGSNQGEVNGDQAEFVSWDRYLNELILNSMDNNGRKSVRG